jgi:hypothetical protein
MAGPYAALPILASTLCLLPECSSTERNVSTQSKDEPVFSGFAQPYINLATAKVHTSRRVNYPSRHLPSVVVTKNLRSIKERTVGLFVNIDLAQVHTPHILAGWQIVV